MRHYADQNRVHGREPTRNGCSAGARGGVCGVIGSLPTAGMQAAGAGGRFWRGAGWIAVVIVIFGGWHPLRATLGAYLFAPLQVVGIHLQVRFPGLPAPLFQVAAFPVMILSLLLVNTGRTAWFQDLMFRYPGLKALLVRWQVNPPAALGRDFKARQETWRVVPALESCGLF